MGAESSLASKPLPTVSLPAQPESMDAYAPPGTALPPLSGFDGTLTLESTQGTARARVLEDSFSIAANPQLNVTELPAFAFDFVTDGSTIIPQLQTPQRSTHPYWEIMLRPGRAWHDPADGSWSRASLPFALKEHNQNCTHNGVMRFTYRPDGSVSPVSWQVSSETCLYLKVNLWGMVPAKYEPGAIDNADEIVAEHRRDIAARMPVRSLDQLAEDTPGLDLQKMTPRGASDTSVWGFAIDGKHYRSNCPTRHGLNPYCDELVVPSYSLAKSIFAGLYYLHMMREWPEFAGLSVSSLVPECRLPDGRWDDVTMSNLINMTTGNYETTDFGQDEDAVKMQEFFLATSHAGKINFSCSAWPRQAVPGVEAVYHTTDDYILGTAMNAFVRQVGGPEVDIHRDHLYPTLLQPLQLSPLMQWTQRTYDDAAQPFTAYGLVMLADDLVRIAASLNNSYGEQQLFDSEGLNQALFRDQDSLKRWFGGRGNAYRNGFWGRDISDLLGCKKETWVPFMSGYGGIVVALIPNGTIYYYFSDSNIHSAVDAMAESNKIRNYCKE
jgi:hypothetical protein